MRQTLVPRNVTRSTKLLGAQRAAELALRSTEFRSLENLNFPALIQEIKKMIVAKLFQGSNKIGTITNKKF